MVGQANGFPVTVDIDNVDGCGGMRGAIGLGCRVPRFVISPYSRGGPVAHGRFDETSQLQLIGKRFGVPVPKRVAGRPRRCRIGCPSRSRCRSGNPGRSLPKRPTVGGVHVGRLTRVDFVTTRSWVRWRGSGYASGNKIDGFGYIFPRIALAC